MTSSVRTGVFLAAVASLAGCDGARPAVPTAPTTPTRPTATVSGLVFTSTATGLNPAVGARVRLEIGSYQQDALTDASGRYRLTELYDGPSMVTTTLDGYDTDTRTVTVRGDVILDIGIIARVAYTLSGTVFEETSTGRVPVPDVEIYCDSCGSPVGHTFVHTDADGFYSLGWTYNGANPLLVTKANYEIADPRLKDGFGRVTPMVQGDTRFDVQLARRRESDAGLLSR